MNSLRSVIGTLMANDAPLNAVATGGVHFRLVQDTDLRPPFCIFHFEGGNEMWASDGGGIYQNVLVVKGCSPDPSEAEDIDEAAKDLLDDADGVFLFCRRLGAIPDYDDVANGDAYFYKGSRYRVSADKASL